MKSEIILAVLCGVLLNCDAQNLDKQTFTKMDILYVPLYIETAATVNCDEFEYWFQNSIKTKTIYNCKDINDILMTIESLTLADKRFYPYPNTRIKLKLYSKDSISEICIDVFLVQYNNKSFINTLELLKKIDRLVGSNGIGLEDI